MDAITMLKDDHRTVERLFKGFERAGERAYVEKRKIVDMVIEELAKHAAVEEQLFYPVARATVGDTEDIVLESLEEHHIVKWLLAELDGMDATAERFDAKVTVLIENVRHHVEEEETEFFPKVRAGLDRRALSDLGDAMQKLKAVAPTHAHPRAPDTPPANAGAGTSAGMMDRIGDTVSGVAQGSVSAMQDVVALILGRRKRASSPTGSGTTRHTAKKVRAGVSSVTDDAIAAATRTMETASSAKTGVTRTARAAAKGTKDTARTAKAGAKRTVRTARSSAKQTSSTAKRATTPTKRAARSTAKKPTATGRGATKATKRAIGAA